MKIVIYISAIFSIILLNSNLSISQNYSKEIKSILLEFNAEKEKDTVTAYRLIQQATEIAKTNKDTFAIAKCLREKANYLGILDSVGKAMQIFSTSIQYFNLIDKRFELAETYFSYGSFLKNKNKYSTAIYQFSQAEKLFLGEKKYPRQFDCIIQSGTIIIIQGNWALAMKKFVEALEIAQRIKSPLLIAEAWHHIGIVHWKEGNNQKALEVYNKSLKLRLKNSDSLGIASSYSNIGVINKIEKKYAVALNYYRKSLGIRQRYKDLIGTAQVLFNIGSVQQELKQFDEALLYYDKSLSIKNELKDNYGKLSCYLNSGEIYRQTKHFDKAENVFKLGLSLSQKIGANDYIKSFLRELSLLFEKLSKFEEAYNHHVAYMQIKDTLLSREKNQELIELQTKYDIAEKQRNIEKLEEENKLSSEKESRASWQRNSLIFIVILAIVLIVLVFNRVKFLQRTNSKLNEQKIEIEKREKEKELLLREIHHRVKNNLQLTSSLLNLQSRQVKDSEASNSLKEARDRIKAISLIHQKLYTRDQFSNVDLKIYIPELCQSLLETSGSMQEKIEFSFDLVSIIISLDEAISIGLILNEAITNSIKHAFNDMPHGNISLNSTYINNILSLEIKDNGTGKKTKTSVEEGFGMQLMNSLALKLKAKLEINQHNGTKIKLIIPIQETT